MRHLRTLPVLFALPFAAGAQSAPSKPLPLKHRPAPTHPAITEGDLETRLYIFADDSMLGRDAGKIGDVKATDYIAREARRIGLRPAGDSGGYFQVVPLVARRVDSASTIRVGDSTIAVGRDFLVQPFGDPRPLDSAVAMFAGRAGDTTTRLTPEETRGRLLVYLSGDLAPTPELLAAKAVAIVGPPSFPPEMAQALLRPSLILPGRSTFGDVPTILLVTPAAAARLLGADPASLAPRASGRTVHGALRYDDRTADYPSRNVIAILPGSDPKLRGEFVALGAHSDHLGARGEGPLDHDSLYVYNRLAAKHPPTSPIVDVDSLRRVRPPRADSVFNGADDDGTGSMALLEIAEKLAAPGARPKRSVLFIWHTAEEKGLYGSQWYGEHTTVPRDSMVANIDIDMIGRGSAEDLAGGGPAYLLSVGSRRLSTELGDVLDRVNAKEPHPFTIDLQYDAPGHPEQLYCRSDHVNYARWGIPAVALSTGLHPDYHQLTDEPQDIDYRHYAAITRFLADFTRALANLDHRPALDHPKPDPNAPCRQ